MNDEQLVLMKNNYEMFLHDNKKYICYGGGHNAGKKYFYKALVKKKLRLFIEHIKPKWFNI